MSHTTDLKRAGGQHCSGPNYLRTVEEEVKGRLHMSISSARPGDAHHHHHHRVGRTHAFVAVVVAVVLSVLGTGLVANAADQVAVSITDTLSPASLTIHVGATVTWTNNDAGQHELRSQSGPVEFRTDTLDRGQSASFTFNTEGTYTYLDHRNHDSMAYHGTIIVTNGTAPTPPTTPGATPPATPAPPATAAVQLAGAQFSPSTVTVAVGGTVTWSNNDGSKHTVTADNASFDSGTLNAGATFTHTFTAAGTYTYGCDFHGNMRGTVIVAAATGTPTPAPTAPTPTVPAPTPTPAPTVPAPAPAVPAAPGSGATSESVNIAGNAFSPSTITVNAGSTVTWTNNDTVTHTATADDQSFVSGLLKKATSWAHTFATPGTFNYFCEIHPEMIGTVIAKAPDGSLPAAAPAPATVTTATPSATGTTSQAGSAGGSAATGTITINDSGFTPSNFRIAVGGSLTFANQGKAMHTVTAGNGSFDSDMIKSGGSWVHTFTTVGSFTYSCILHPNMRGTVDVGRGGSPQAIETAAAPEAAVTDTGGSAPTTAATDLTASTILPVNIDVADNEFKPNTATVAVGGTVTWKLIGQAAHTVTADDQSFNSGLLKPGESYPFTFSTLGSFTYTCLVHPGMTGTIEVVPPEQAAALQPAPTAGGSAQAQQVTSQPEAAASAAPAKSAGVWGDTLVGIAAVLLACCALLFALKSFLKVLGSNGPVADAVPSPSEALPATPI